MTGRTLTAFIVGLALAGGLTACGGSDATGDVVPAGLPALVPPTDANLAPNASGGTSSTASSTTSKTSTTDTTSTDDTSSDDTSSDTSSDTGTDDTSTDTGTDDTGTDDTGGAGTDDGTGGTQTPDTGGASSGGFDDFCAQNPGACPDQ